MLLKEPTSQEIEAMLDDIIHMEETLDGNSDGSNRIAFETEVTCLEQHTGVKLHKLLEDRHV